MNPLHFAACCLFAVMSIGALKSFSTHQNKVETQRLMKRQQGEVRAAQRKLIEGLEAVHWKITFDYLEDRDLESLQCGETSFEDFITVGIRVVGQGFVRQYTERHLIAEEDAAWEVGPLPDDERRRLVKEEPTNSATVADSGQGRKLFGFSGTKHLIGYCTICNPRNDLIHEDTDRGRQLRYDPELHPKYLTGIISRFLMDKVKQYCIPDLQHLVFEMIEEEKSI